MQTYGKSRFSVLNLTQSKQLQILPKVILFKAPLPKSNLASNLLLSVHIHAYLVIFNRSLSSSSSSPPLPLLYLPRLSPPFLSHHDDSYAFMKPSMGPCEKVYGVYMVVKKPCEVTKPPYKKFLQGRHGFEPLCANLLGIHCE